MYEPSRILDLLLIPKIKLKLKQQSLNSFSVHVCAAVFLKTWEKQFQTAFVKTSSLFIVFSLFVYLWNNFYIIMSLY